MSYLRHSGWISAQETATARELGWGVSNVVLRVEAGNRSVVLKQSRPQLRTAAEWFSNVDRVFREMDVLRALARVLPEGSVPRVLFEDRANYLFGMSPVVADHKVWKELLLQGQVDLELGTQAGFILGSIHAGTAGNAELAELLRDNENFIQLRVEPFYWRMKPKHPDLSDEIDAVVEEMLRTRVCLTHADFSPKNILVHPGGITLVDFETGHWGDPAFDLGFFLSHIILKSIHAGAEWERYLELTRVFWTRYRAQIAAVSQDTEPLREPELLRRSMRHLGLCMLARMDGASPVDYLNRPGERETARALGRAILGQQAASWKTTREIIRSHLPLGPGDA